MWICLNDAFISAVQHRDKPNHLMVRARRREHLAAVFPEAEIIETPTADYRWRVVVTKNAFKKGLLSDICGSNQRLPACLRVDSPWISPRHSLAA